MRDNPRDNPLELDSRQIGDVLGMLTGQRPGAELLDRLLPAFRSLLAADAVLLAGVGRAVRSRRPSVLRADPDDALLFSLAKAPEIQSALEFARYLHLEDYPGSRHPLPTALSWGLQSLLVLPIHGGELFEGALLVLWRRRQALPAPVRGILDVLHPRLMAVLPASLESIEIAAEHSHKRAILEHLPQAALFLESDGAMGWLNPPAARLLGLPSGALAPAFISHAMSEFQQAARNAEEIQHVALSIWSNPEIEITDWIWHVHEKIYSVTTRPTNVNGFRGRIWFWSDITAAERQKQELLDARRLAETATAAKTSFLANMSHEIRTPLNGLLGVLSLLGQGPLTAEQHSYLETARDSGAALLQIINDILDLSKIEAGHLRFEEIPFDLEHLLANVAKLFESQAILKQVSLGLQFPPTLHRHFHGDPARIRQVLANLLSNAVKFTEHGSIELRVRCEEADEEADLLSIEVADTGIGIPADALSRIFESFVQADASTNRRYGGTGLGLALSRQLVERMGGALTVASTPGRGSTFTVRLWLRTADPALSAGPAASAETQEPWAARLAGCRILLAEDNRVNRLVARRCLEDAGCRVTVAEDGVQALDQWRQSSFEAVVMDCQMPHMDGYEAARAIRDAEQPSGRRVPILALTANAYSEDRERCLAAGMDDHLSKPFDRQTLLATLSRLINRRAGASA